MPEFVAPCFHSLRLQDLSLQVRVGCEAPERSLPQNILVSVEFRFHEAPQAIYTDELADGLCYAKIAERILRHCETREYKLIEALGFDIYKIAHDMAGAGVAVTVSVHKVKPPVARLHGGSWYRCGDFST